MKYFLCFILFGPILLYSQKTKEYFINQNDKKVDKINAVYYRSVTKSGNEWLVTDSYLNGNIVRRTAFSDSFLKKRTNRYSYYYINGTPYCEGYGYVNDKKHGKWKYFYINGKIKQEEEYTLGKITGKWTWYNEEGEQTNNVDYASKEIIAKKIKKAKFPGGVNAYSKYIDKLKKPKESFKKGYSGKTYLSFKIDTMGNIKNAEIIISGNEEMDSLVIKRIKQMPKWTAASKFGKPVESWFLQTVSFLQNEKSHVYVSDKAIAEGFFNVAVKYYKLKNFKDAEKHVKSAISRSAEDPRFYGLLALCYSQQEKTELSCDYWKIAYLLDKNIVSSKVIRNCNL